MTRQRSVAPWALALLLLSALATTRARAAGIDVPDLGAESLGKGGADAAAPDSLMAIYYNPAGLARLQGFQFLIDARGLQETTSFQSYATNAAAVTDQGNKGTGGFLLAPAFGLSYGFKLVIPWTIAIGGMPPTGYSNDAYPNYFSIVGPSSDVSASVKANAANASPQRYTLISNTSTGYVLSLSLAAEPLPFLTLGAQFQVPLYSFNIAQSAYLGTQASTAASYDALVNIKASNGFDPSGAFGMSWKLPAGFQIGASAQLPTDIDASGTMGTCGQYKNVPCIPASSLLAANSTILAPKGNDVTFKITLPWMLRAGVRVDQPAYELELDGVYEAWSMYKDITVTPEKVNVQVAVATGAGQTQTKTYTTQPFPSPLVTPTGMTDAYSLRLGGELRPGAFNDKASFLKVRAGVMYESSAVPINYTSLNETNWDRWIPTVGLGFAVWKFDINVAYAHAFQPERFVTNSAVTQSPTPVGQQTVVGNGTYNVDINMVALSFAGHFG